MPYDCVIVEVDGEAVGLLAKAGEEYQFIASAPEAFVLDATVYSSMAEAFRAVRKAVHATHMLTAA